MERFHIKGNATSPGLNLAPHPDGEWIKAADAQATIAALQAKVSELQGIADEKCRCFLERAEQSEKQLTQRTAELEAANKLLYRKNCELGRFETIISDLQAELERVRGELVETSLYLQQERANRDSLAACVDRDVKTIKELREQNRVLREALEAWMVYYEGHSTADNRDRAYFMTKAALTATSQPVPPYKEWCRHPEKCAGLASCPQDPTCAD